MALLRLFVVAALIYCLLYLVKQIFMGRKDTEAQSIESEPEEVQDVLVEDPICHKLLPKKEALRCKYDHEIVYFCSEECCEIFEKSQEEKE